MEQLRIHPDERFEVFVVFDPVKGSLSASNMLLEPVQRRINHTRLVGFNFSIFLLWEKCRTANIATMSFCCKPKPEAMPLNKYRQQSEYCFTSLSAQSWQYRDRRKPEVGTILYLTLIERLQGFFIVHTTIDHTAHSRPLNSLEHCICTASRTHIRPGRDSKPVPLSFEPQLDRMSHRGRPILFLASPGEKLIDGNMPLI